MSKDVKKVLIIPGDGIGTEVTAEAVKVLKKVCHVNDISIELDYADLGGVAYDKWGTPFPPQTLEKAKQSDAILLGAVGGPKWEALDYSVRPERGLLGIRKELDLFANLRPAKTFAVLASASSLKEHLVAGLDIMIIRELTSGIYFGNPRGVETLPNGEQRGFNTEEYTTSQVKRIAKVAFEVAGSRAKNLCSIDKANVLEVTEMWRNIVTAENANYKNINLSHMYVDNAAMQLVRSPKQFDVIVTNNLFGDILSDIAAMLTGSLGMLPSASLGALREDGKRYALYEPVHGSAPDIAGKGIANPLATILSVAMLLKYSFNNNKAAKSVEDAVERVLNKGFRTADIYTLDSDASKKLSTKEMGEAVLSEL
jgi:3-isopropylmalate dehydrogenase